jgi:hypothetical protein
VSKKFVVCGDSFSAGIGCVDMYTQPYGILVARHFNAEPIILARGSASNYAIYLQALHAADMEIKPDLVIIAQTSYDRIEWVREDRQLHLNARLENLNYHLYPPHQIAQPHHDSPMPFYLQGSGDYNPVILSEQIGGIDDCIKSRKKGTNVSKYYMRLRTEPTEKLELIRDYFVNIVDDAIKKDYDIGLLLQAYTYVVRKGIDCIVLTHEPKINNYIDDKDIMFQDWYIMSKNYPDTIGSMHTSEEGHRDTADRLVTKIGVLFDD